MKKPAIPFACYGDPDKMTITAECEDSACLHKIVSQVDRYAALTIYKPPAATFLFSAEDDFNTVANWFCYLAYVNNGTIVEDCSGT